ncbi:MAG: ferritin-like domain-containing protein [Balneolaceae bacterium]|nr:ferritin-like domain-containing protein [Balneolaceae bacterium]
MQQSEQAKKRTEEPNCEQLGRKEALKKLRASGKKLARAALPLSLIGITANKTFAQFEDLEIGRALNFILQIEFMQEAFYVQATGTNGLFDSVNQKIFTEIRQQHQARVVLVKNLIGSLDIDPAPQMSFNFTSGGEFNPFGSFDGFLNMAQIIEDTAAGVYKKQAAIIFQHDASAEMKRIILRLHSTESRHAYFIRFRRAERGLDDIKGWINQANLGTLSAAFENIYRDEGTTTQEEVDIPSVTDASTQAIQEAWDEPISRGTAGAILQLFTRPL